MSIFRLPDSLDKDIAEYARLVKGYLNGTIDKAQLKAFRVPMGIYEQRENEKYMMRFVIPGGDLSPMQLYALAEIAKKYSPSDLHITTRGDMQLHGINLPDTIVIIKKLRTIGLTTRGGGGNTVRNILIDYLSGLDPEEAFDVAPYAQELASRLISEPDSFTLPRKFKIAFSSSPEDRGKATVNDLGFIAETDKNGNRGFKVYIGGGMGLKPRTGIVLFDFAPDTEVYNIAKAAKDFFNKYGNRKNKHAARLRFVLSKLGENDFLSKFSEEYERVKALSFPPFDIKPVETPGDYGYILIPLFLGDISPESAENIAEIAMQFETASIRLTSQQNLIIKGIPNESIKDIREQIPNTGIPGQFPSFIGNAVACAGASTCRLGICLSRNLLSAIKDITSEKAYPNTDDLSLKISGCPNTCGQHIIADIGFFGRGVRFGKSNAIAPAYNVVLGGHLGNGVSSLAENIGVIAAKKIPEFMGEVLGFIGQNRLTDEAFSEFIKRVGKNEFTKILDKYGEIPDIEENKDYYYDWGDDKPFSISERLEGECSAGLFDLIETDLKTAKDKLTSNLPREALYYSLRALLITRGIVPGSESETVSGFNKFFLGKYIEQSYETLIKKFVDSGEIRVNEAEDFYNRIEWLYEQMDNSLKFPELAHNEDKTDNATEPKENIKDFREIPCPMNFVKAKMALENIEIGERLEIYIDDGEPIDNVPPSLRNEGHSIVSQKRIGDYWSIVVERRV
jgi:sulfite reductase (ferredoxin)